MARPTTADYFQNNRFQLAIVDGSGFEAFTTEAGFSACTLPEATVEQVEYREGNYLYSRKQPGNVSMNDLTLSRGVVLTETNFFTWMMQVVEGAVGTHYRADLAIKHYHRDALPGTNAPAAGNQTVVALDQASTFRTYTCYEAFPIRHKVASDLDATSSDISVAELDVGFEYFDMTTEGG